MVVPDHGFVYYLSLSLSLLNIVIKEALPSSSVIHVAIVSLAIGKLFPAEGLLNCLVDVAILSRF